MSFQVDQALVQAYKANIDLLAQQKGSRLAATVRNETQNAEFEYYDRIGSVNAVEVTTRHADTPLISTPHDRRRIGLRDFDWADLIDRKDKLRMLNDPTSSYVINAVAALSRSKDDVIIGAATGAAYSGKTGGTVTAFDTANQQIAVDFSTSGTPSNLTVKKLIEARRVLMANEVIQEDELATIAVTSNQIASLLNTTQVTSADYNTVKALVNGEIDTFAGFKFVQTERLNKSGNNRSCLAYVQSGIILATALEIAVDVAPRPDKRNAIQVYVCGSFGASRMEEKKVVEILCDETK